MITIVSSAEMQAMADKARAEGQVIGLVPTMGFLHRGHLSLIELARKSCDVVVTSVFVNPTQFAPHEDFDKYPRDLKRDAELCEKAGTTLLFTPPVSEMYPAGHSTFVTVDGLSGVLEGKFRPTHFRGVTTVVSMLFTLTKPHKAFFGQKDAQQCAVVKRMTQDLHFGVEIIVAPIIRESDGLALSSRNIYLSPQERIDAAILHAALCRAKELVAGGERKVSQITADMKNMIAGKKSATVDYVEIVHAETFAPLDTLERNVPALALLAVRIGTTRLIDNEFLKLS